MFRNISERDNPSIFEFFNFLFVKILSKKNHHKTNFDFFFS